MALALLLLRLWGASLRSWRVEERERGAKSLNYLHFEKLNPSLRHLTALACGTAAAAHIERVNFALNFTRGIKAEVHWGGCNIKYVRRKTMGFGFSGVCFFLLEFWMKIEIISVFSFFFANFSSLALYNNFLLLLLGGPPSDFIFYLPMFFPSQGTYENLKLTSTCSALSQRGRNFCREWKRIVWGSPRP